MAVPGPTWVRSSFSSRDSIVVPPRGPLAREPGPAENGSTRRCRLQSQSGRTYPPGSERPLPPPQGAGPFRRSRPERSRLPPSFGGLSITHILREAASKIIPVEQVMKAGEAPPEDLEARLAILAPAEKATQRGDLPNEVAERRGGRQRAGGMAGPPEHAPFLPADQGGGRRGRGGPRLIQQAQEPTGDHAVHSQATGLAGGGLQMPP